MGLTRKGGDGEMQLLLYLEQEKQHNGGTALQIPKQEIRNYEQRLNPQLDGYSPFEIE